VLNQNTQLCIAYELTQAEEFVKTMNVELWKKTKINFHKKPAIFIIHQQA
jgi:16S rRNA (cytidine1402-2'-O)-methyltransferase